MSLLTTKRRFGDLIAAACKAVSHAIVISQTCISPNLFLYNRLLPGYALPSSLLHRKPRPLAVTGTRLNSVALLDSLRSVQFSSVQSTCTLLRLCMLNVAFKCHSNVDKWCAEYVGQGAASDRQRNDSYKTTTLPATLPATRHPCRAKARMCSQIIRALSNCTSKSFVAEFLDTPDTFIRLYIDYCSVTHLTRSSVYI